MTRRADLSSRGAKYVAWRERNSREGFVIPPGDFGIGNGGLPIEITIHARQRWRERLPDWALKHYPLNPRTWDEAVVVIAPTADCDETRLVEIIGAERDMILCAKHHPDKTVVVTVMYADYDRLRYP